MKNETTKKILLFSTLYLFFFLLSCYMVSRADDFVFQAGIQRYGSIAGWAKWFSQNWGGRIIPQGILVLLLQLSPLIFHFIDALVWVLLLIYIKKIFDVNGLFHERFFFVLLPLLIFILIPFSVLSGTVFWKCANVLYLWGSAALLIAIYPAAQFIHQRQVTRFDYIISLVCVIYVSSFEQAGILMCGVLFLFLLYAFFSHHPVKLQMILLFVLAIVCTCFFCTLPGNGARTHIEVLGQMPNYDMYSTLDKVLWGIWYVIHYIEQEAMYIIMLLAGTVVYLMRQNRKSNDPLLWGAYFMLLYFVVCTMNWIGLSNGGTGYFLSDIFQLVQVDTAEFGFNRRIAVFSIIHFMAYIYLGSCILIVVPEEINITGFSFYFGGLATMWMMGFSPTIYASGARPRFLCYLFLLCCEIQIISCATFKDPLSRSDDIYSKTETGQPERMRCSCDDPQKE
ncbi:MAG: DUF6056 family protein [Lachnospiraceae bacterium]|jgi:hypothetical protein|nr:DUF6056 family protein [Lachnospiraceae bacterium]MCI1329284.1 DUF6056 family protein [Lachnospiraceae bacterium]